MKREEVLEQVWGCRMLGTESNLSGHCSFMEYGDFND